MQYKVEQGTGVIPNYLMSALLACVLAVAAFYGERINNEQNATAVRTEVRNRLVAIRDRLEGNLNDELQLVEGLESVITSAPDLNQRQFDQAVGPLFSSHTRLRTIVAAPDMVIRMIYPLAGNENTVGLDYRKMPEQIEGAERARRTRRIVLAGPVPLVQGGIGLITHIPVLLSGSDGQQRFWGLLSAVIDDERLFRDSGLLDKDPSIDIAVRGKDAEDPAGKVFFGSPGLFSRSPVLADIHLPFGTWQLAAVPRGGWPRPAKNAWLFRVGFGLTALIILGAFFALGRAWRAAAFDRERADAARRQLSATLENAPGIAVQWYDVQGRVLYWNPASEPLYGWSAEEALGKTLDRLFGTPAEAAEFLGLLQETSVTGARVGPTEFRVHNRSGEARCVESTIFTIPGDTPGDTICACMGVDITERKQAEESLNRTEAHYRNLFEDAPVMYTLTLSDGGRPRIADCNILFARTLGYERDAILGRLLEDFYSEESRNALLNEGGYAYALRNPLASVERQLIARDGRQLLTLLSAQPYLDAGGQPIGTRAIFADVSELKRMEVELRASKEAADAASRAKSDFLATMSHEIRTPMNGVLGMTELLLGTELDDQQRRFVQTIRRSAYSLLSIVSDILDFSKIEAGKLKLDIAPFDLAELVQSAADMLEEQAREKGLKLVVRLVPSLPQAVSGDANGLRQVLVNLICNAVKFTEQGEVMVRVLMAEENAETVRFEVKDTGAGIRAMDRDTLFHAFTQGDGSTTRRYGGTGLGLAICRELVELMDGRIGVEDASPSGSLFWFEVALPPARISVIQSVDEAEQTRWAAIDAADDPDRFPRIRARILLAEDNPVNQEVGRSMLEALGCDVVLAADGLAAVQAMQDEDIDLVLMDCHMPGQDGFEATRLIRTREKAEDRVPILALTADVLKGTPELCRAAGMDAYLSKPFNMQVLDDALKKWLPKAPDDSASAAADPEPSASVDGLLDLEVLGRIQALQLPGKPSVIGRVIGLFLESAPDLLEGIRAALSGRDAHALSDRAHSLKSSSANLGAEDLVLLCASLEEAGREKRLDDATVLLNRLEAVFPATLDALRSQLRPD